MNDLPEKLSFLTEALEERRGNSRYRSLRPAEPVFGSSKVKVRGKELINFCSNDYLGLSSHPKVVERSIQFTQRYGSGSGASRLVSGSLDIHHRLEEKLADTFGREAALLFNSGFQANTSLLACLADRNSLILADKKSHNSLIQGALLSRGAFRRFEHNDYRQLEELLKKASSKHYNRIWIVSETVFSMDGDRSDLQILTSLAEQYDALLYSDDAHALGVLGENGRGLNYDQKGIHLSLGTFGKAFGSFGAFAGCSLQMKEYLINHAPGFIYTTALPPGVIGAIDAALELIPEMEAERAFLFDQLAHLRKELTEIGYEAGNSDSQIVPVITGSEEEAISLSNYLEENGLWVSSIRPPTVPEGASRIRITLTAGHIAEEIEALLDALRTWKNR